MAGKFDEIINIGFKIEDVSDKLATMFGKYKDSTALKLSIDDEQARKDLDAFFDELKKLQDIKFKNDPMNWKGKEGAKLALNQMKEISTSMSKLSSKSGDEFDKLVEKLAFYSKRYTELGGDLKKVPKGLQENLASIGNKEFKFDVSKMIDKKAIDEQTRIVSEAYERFSEIIGKFTGFDLGKAFKKDADIGSLLDGLDKLYKKAEITRTAYSNLQQEIYPKKNLKNGGIMFRGLSDATDKFHTQTQDALSDISKLKNEIKRVGANATQENISKWNDKFNELSGTILPNLIRELSFVRESFEQISDNPKIGLDNVIAQYEELSKKINELEEQKLKYKRDQQNLFALDVNNTNNPYIMSDIHNLLLKRKADLEVGRTNNADYELSKAAALYGKSGIEDKVMLYGEDFTQKLIDRWNELQRNVGQYEKSAEEIRRLDKDINDLLKERSDLESGIKNIKIGEEKIGLKRLQEVKDSIKDTMSDARKQTQYELSEAAKLASEAKYREYKVEEKMASDLAKEVEKSAEKQAEANQQAADAAGKKADAEQKAADAIQHGVNATGTQAGNEQQAADAAEKKADAEERAADAGERSAKSAEEEAKAEEKSANSKKKKASATTGNATGASSGTTGTTTSGTTTGGTLQPNANNEVELYGKIVINDAEQQLNTLSGQMKNIPLHINATFVPEKTKDLDQKITDVEKAISGSKKKSEVNLPSKLTIADIATQVDDLGRQIKDSGHMVITNSKLTLNPEDTGISGIQTQINNSKQLVDLPSKPIIKEEKKLIDELSGKITTPLQLDIQPSDASIGSFISVVQQKINEALKGGVNISEALNADVSDAPIVETMEQLSDSSTTQQIVEQQNTVQEEIDENIHLYKQLVEQIKIYAQISKELEKIPKGYDVNIFNGYNFGERGERPRLSERMFPELSKTDKYGTPERSKFIDKSYFGSFIDQYRSAEKYSQNNDDEILLRKGALENAINNLSAFVVNLRTGTNVAKLFGKENADAFNLVTENIKNATKALPLLNQLKDMFYEIERTANKLSTDENPYLSFGQYDMEEASIRSGFSGVTKLVEDYFQIKIPESILNSQNALDQFGQNATSSVERVEQATTAATEAINNMETASENAASSTNIQTNNATQTAQTAQTSTPKNAIEIPTKLVIQNIPGNVSEIQTSVNDAKVSVSVNSKLYIENMETTIGELQNQITTQNKTPIVVSAKLSYETTTKTDTKEDKKTEAQNKFSNTPVPIPITLKAEDPAQLVKDVQPSFDNEKIQLGVSLTDSNVTETMNNLRDVVYGANSVELDVNLVDSDTSNTIQQLSNQYSSNKETVILDVDLIDTNPDTTIDNLGTQYSTNGNKVKLDVNLVDSDPDATINSLSGESGQYTGKKVTLGVNLVDNNMDTNLSNLGTAYLQSKKTVVLSPTLIDNNPDGNIEKLKGQYDGKPVDIGVRLVPTQNGEGGENSNGVQSLYDNKPITIWTTLNVKNVETEISNLQRTYDGSNKTIVLNTSLKATRPAQNINDKIQPNYNDQFVLIGTRLKADNADAEIKDNVQPSYNEKFVTLDTSLKATNVDGQIEDVEGQFVNKVVKLNSTLTMNPEQAERALENVQRYFNYRNFVNLYAHINTENFNATTEVNNIQGLINGSSEDGQGGYGIDLSTHLKVHNVEQEIKNIQNYFNNPNDEEFIKVYANLRILNVATEIARLQPGFDESKDVVLVNANLTIASADDEIERIKGFFNGKSVELNAKLTAFKPIEQAGTIQDQFKDLPVYANVFLRTDVAKEIERIQGYYSKQIIKIPSKLKSSLTSDISDIKKTLRENKSGYYIINLTSKLQLEVSAKQQISNVKKELENYLPIKLPSTLDANQIDTDIKGINGKLANKSVDVPAHLYIQNINTELKPYRDKINDNSDTYAINIPTHLKVQNISTEVGNIQTALGVGKEAKHSVKINSKLNVDDVDGEINTVTGLFVKKPVNLKTHLYHDGEDYTDFDDIQTIFNAKPIKLQAHLDVASTADTQITRINGELAAKPVTVNIIPSEIGIENFTDMIQNNLPMTDDIVQKYKGLNRVIGQYRQNITDAASANREVLNTSLIAERELDKNGNTSMAATKRKLEEYKVINEQDVQAKKQALDVLSAYTNRLKSADNVAKVFGKKNSDIYDLVRKNIEDVMRSEEAYDRQMENRKAILKEINDIASKNNISPTADNINEIVKATQETGITGFAEKVKELFGVEVPSSIEKAREALADFKNQTKSSAKTGNEMLDGVKPVKIPISPKIDPEKFIGELNTELEPIRSSTGIDTIPINIVPGEINVEAFNSTLNARINEYKTTSKNLDAIDVPVTLSDKVSGDTSVKDAVNSEVESIRSLIDLINKDLINAIKEKTLAFTNENKVVTHTVNTEKYAFNNLKGTLGNVKTALQSIKDLADVVKIDSTPIIQLSDALDKLSGKTVPDFSSLKNLNDILKMSKGRAEKFNEYSTHISQGLDNIMKAFANGNYSNQIASFISQIQQLANSSTEFKSMVEALKNFDSIGKSTISSSIKDFRKATNDYISAYNTNAQKNNAESQYKLVAATQALGNTMRELHDLESQGLIDSQRITEMANERANAVGSAIQSINAEKVANENSNKVIKEYTEACKNLYKAKMDLLKAPSDRTLEQLINGTEANDADALQYKFEQAKAALLDLERTGAIETEKLNKILQDNEEAYEPRYADKIKREIEKIDKLISNGTYRKAINKFTDSLKIYDGVIDASQYDNLQATIDSLETNLHTMADNLVSDFDRIKASVDFKDVNQSLNSTFNTLKFENPFQELSPKNVGLEFTEYIDGFDALQTKAKELNQALKNNDGSDAAKEAIKELHTEVNGLKLALDNLRKNEGKEFVKIKTNLQNMSASTKGAFDNTDLVNKLKRDAAELEEAYNRGSSSINEYIKRGNEILDNYHRINTFMKGSVVKTNIQDQAQAMQMFQATVARTGVAVNQLKGDMEGENKTIYHWTQTVREADGTLKQISATYDSVNKIMSYDTKIVGKELVGLAGAIDLIKKKYKELAVYWTSMLISPFRIIGYVKQAVSIVHEYDDALTEMKKVSKDSAEALAKFQDASFKLANSVGTTGLQLQKSAAEFMRLGETIDLASKHAQEANILFNVSEYGNIEDATEAFVAMTQAYKEVESLDVVNKLNVIGNNFAISTEGLSKALQRSSASLKTAGNVIARIYSNIYRRIYLIALSA